jgi:hypothetical protein
MVLRLDSKLKRKRDFVVRHDAVPVRSRMLLSVKPLAMQSPGHVSGSQTAQLAAKLT